MKRIRQMGSERTRNFFTWREAENFMQRLDNSVEDETLCNAKVSVNTYN